MLLSYYSPLCDGKLIYDDDDNECVTKKIVRCNSFRFICSRSTHSAEMKPYRLTGNHGDALIHSRSLVSADEVSSAIDPSAYVIRQNANQRRSRLYIGKRPAAGISRSVPRDHQAVVEDEETNAPDEQPWIDILLEKAAEWDRQRDLKGSASVRVKRRSTSGSGRTNQNDRVQVSAIAA